MAKSKTKKGLVRFLGAGERLRIIGQRGKPVKRTRSGRKYVVQVIKKRKVVNYVNPVKKGAPQPREFTNSMLARLKYTSRQKIHQRPINSGKPFILTSKKLLKKQISKKILAKIRKNRGKAFNFKIQVDRNQMLSHSIYVNGRMTDENLINLITSDLLYTLGRDRYRISPKLEGVEDNEKTKRIQAATLQLQFTEILEKPRKPRKPKKKGKNK